MVNSETLLMVCFFAYQSPGPQWVLNSSGNTLGFWYVTGTNAGKITPDKIAVLDYLNACKAKGCKIILSIGGSGADANLSTMFAEPVKLAQSIAYCFFGGSVNPFGWSRTDWDGFSFDGIDIDIEKQTPKADDLFNFLTEFKSLVPASIVTAAPQPPNILTSDPTYSHTALNGNGAYLSQTCPAFYPFDPDDLAKFYNPNSNVPALMSPAHLDMVDYWFVQFYNNPGYSIGTTPFAISLAMYGFNLLHSPLKKSRIIIGLASADGSPVFKYSDDASNLDNGIFAANRLIRTAAGFETCNISNWLAGAGFWNCPTGIPAITQLYALDSIVSNLPSTATMLYSPANTGNDPEWRSSPNIPVATPPEPPPSTPTNLLASSITSVGFVLNWSDDPTAVSNVVSLNNGFTSNTPSNTFSFTDLQPGVSYIATVTSYNVNNIASSPASNTVTTIGGLPQNVPIVESAVQSGLNVNIGWRYEGNDATSTYSISYHNSYLNTNFNTLWNGYQYTIRNNAPATTIFYQVAASNAYGVGGYSPVSSIQIVSRDSNQVQNVRALSTTTSSVSVGWSFTNQNFSYYKVYVNDLYDSSASSTSTTVSNLDANQLYNIKVNAIRRVDGVETRDSSELSVATRPFQPTALTFTNITRNNITADWTGDASYFDISWNSGISNNVANSQLTVNNLNPGTQYTFAVTPYNVCNGRGDTLFGNVTTLPPPTPPSSFPSNINVYIIQSNYVTLSWAYSPADASSYNFYLSGGGIYCNDLGSPVELTGLTSNTAYTLSIAAVNPSGTGPFSTQLVQFTTTSAPPPPPPPPPPAPSNIVVYDITSTSAILNWSTGTGSTADYVIIGNSPTSNVFPPQLISGLTSNTLYNISLQSSNIYGNSVIAGSSFITAPPAPFNLLSTSTSDSITINWQCDASTYNVYLDENFNVNTSNLNQTITGLEAGTSYLVGVLGLNANGISGETTSVTITTSVGIPAFPSNVIVYNIGSNSVTLSWDIVPYISTYRVYIESFVDGDVYSDYTASSPPFTITGELVPNADYTATVYSVNDDGTEGGDSIPESFTTRPSQLTNLTASLITDDGFRLSWSENALYYSVSTTFTRADVYDTTYNVIGLLANNVYDVVVTPFNQNDLSGQSQSIEVRTASANRDPAVNITNLYVSSFTSFTVEWQAISNAAYYYLYVDDVQNIVLQSTRQTVTVPYNTAHTVYLTFVDAGLGESISSTVFDIRVPDRPYPSPLPPQQKKPLCVLPIPTSAKRPIPTFNPREYWSWGNNNRPDVCGRLRNRIVWNGVLGLPLVAPTFQINAVAYGDGMWVASLGSASQSTKIYYSNDGIIWKVATGILPGSLNNFAYGGGMWVVVGDTGGSAIIYYSTNGITWTPVISPVSQSISLYRVAYGGSPGAKWVAVGVGGIGPPRPSLYYSLDGMTWNNSPFTGYSGTELGAVAYADGNNWVVVAGGGSGGGTGVPAISYSPDGATWFGATGIFPAYGSVDMAVAYGDGMWVAVRQPPSGPGVYYSSNGISWTTATGAFPLGGAKAVAYGGGMWVVVGATGSGTNIYYSRDAITWIGVPGPFSGIAGAVAVTYGGGMWVAVGYNTFGNNPRLYQSLDGIIWTGVPGPFAGPPPPPPAPQIAGIGNAVAYGAGRFVAGGYSSIGGPILWYTSNMQY
jgi:hypothetical protein